MDVLCFHEDENIGRDIEKSLRDLGFQAECVLLKNESEIKKIIGERDPAVVLLPKKWKETIDGNALKIFVGERGKNSIILNEDWDEFKHKFMKILLEHRRGRIEKLLQRREVRKNLLYGYGFSWGRTFIVDIKQGKKVRKILPKIAGEDINFFIAVRERPEDFAELPNSKVIWVTDIVGKDRIKPHNLTILTDSIIRYIEEHRNAIILMDCVEYLLLYNDFVNILRNIELINSYVMEHAALMIIIIDSKAYTTKEYSLLSRYAIEWKGA